LVLDRILRNRYSGQVAVRRPCHGQPVGDPIQHGGSACHSAASLNSDRTHVQDRRFRFAAAKRCAKTARGKSQRQSASPVSLAARGADSPWPLGWCVEAMRPGPREGHSRQRANQTRRNRRPRAMLSSNERGGEQTGATEPASVAKEARASDGMARHALHALLRPPCLQFGATMAGSLSRIAARQSRPFPGNRVRGPSPLLNSSSFISASIA
jgi:hypothetical protein